MASAIVIGGAGRMGAWFAKFLKKNGYGVSIYDKDRRAANVLALRTGLKSTNDPIHTIQAARVVVFATPTSVTRELLEKFTPLFSRNTLIVEISSVKEPVRSIIHTLKRKHIPVLSIHPMFGPGIRSLAGFTVLTLLVPTRNLTAKKFLTQLRKEGARILASNLLQHDKIASLTLTLPHFLNIALVNTLKSYEIGANELRRFAGTSFSLQMLMAESIYNENFETEASILMDSKNSLKALAAYLKQSTKILRTIMSGDEASLLVELKSGRSFLKRDEMFANAYWRFTAAVEAANLDRTDPLFSYLAGGE
jgi:prephenate dehydrogenase